MLLARFCLFNKLISSPTLNLRPLPTLLSTFLSFSCSPRRELFPECATEGGGGGPRTCANMQVCARVCARARANELCSLSPQRRVSGCMDVSSSSLFIQLQISEQQVYTHYLPFMGWQVLVKITIFRMDRLEPPPSKISRFTKIIPHIYMCVCVPGVWCMVCFIKADTGF